VWFKLTNSQ